ncbi:hypothetical protein [Paenibacillus soyae]|uniref:Uncharacterized protein n=1 Tax=Paenibacillus soyae TaxID=2969249 RepID=A0A9X2SDW2_9BACL|nr:hypothetical protein [Paenibacillus soyae]MCR2807517.1 hypothetical protein [Paenibacillus soyae]
MNYSNSSKEIDFTGFLGQKVLEIFSVGLELLDLKLENGIINVECSWRLRLATVILIGINEKKETDFSSILKDRLISKSITNIHYFETGDLIIQFEENHFLDLFADSSTFEHYQLYLGEKLFLIGR